MLEELIEIIFVTLLVQCLEYGVCLFDKSINKIILAHIKSIQFNQDKPLDDMAWQNTERNIQIPSWREGNSDTVRR